MKAILTLIIVAYTSLVASQSIDDLFAIAVQNRPEIKAAYADFEAEVERIAAVSGFPNPSLSMGYFISPIETRVGPQIFRASLSQRIPWWGEIKASENVQKAKAEVAYQQYIVALNELYMEVYSAYARYLEWEQKYNNAVEEQELRMQSLDLKRQQYAQGEATLSDITRAEMALDDIKRITAQYSERKNEFKALMSKVIPNAPEKLYQSNINLPDSLPVEQDTIENAFTAVYDKKDEVLNKQKSMIQKKKVPKLNVGIDYMLIGDNNLPASDAGRDAWMPMVGFSLPLFNNDVNSELRSLEKERQALHWRKDEALAQARLVRIEIATAYNNRMKDIAFFTGQENKTDMLIELVINEYKIGNASYAEVIELQQQRLQYSDAKIEATANAILLMAQYRVYSGQLETREFLSTQPK